MSDFAVLKNDLIFRTIRGSEASMPALRQSSQSEQANAWSALQFG